MKIWRLMRASNAAACLFLAFSAFTLSGCKRIDCGEYFDYLDESRDRQEILNWADSYVFNREFGENSLRLGSLVGPGKRALKSTAIGSKFPSRLAGMEVRVVGEDEAGVSALFVGRGNYKGILITRDLMPDSLRSLSTSIELLDDVEGRTAVMCYQEKENMAKK